MGKTIADELIAKGEHRGMQQAALTSRRQTLLRLMQRRFGDVPPEITRTVEATEDLEQLVVWLDRFATAQSVREVGIGPAD